jgi:retron-type reverse transcriptase
MFITNINIYKLKGRVRYFGYVLVSILLVVFSSIYQVILSAQKAAVVYQSRDHVFPKMNKIRPQNWTIVPLLNLGFGRNKVSHSLPRSDGFKEYRICNSTGNTYGILCMCTSHRRMLKSVAGETRKNFSTLLGEKKNESASNYKSMEKIETNWFTNDEKLFEKAVSVDSLKRAWFALKSKPGMSTKGTDNVTLSGISDAWFIKTSMKLLEGSYQYPNKKRVLIDKPGGGKRPLTIANPRIKVIERALLNALEPQFEGYFSWETINGKEYLSETSKNTYNSNYKTTVIDNESLYFKKKVLCPTVFYAHNYGSRPKKSAHQALKNIKHWRTNTTFLIDYDISKAFDNVNRKRLKNLFTKRIKDTRFWNEISKILNSGAIHDLQLIFEKKKVAQGSILSPFLFNIYMHELDEKVVSLQKLTHETHKSHESAVYGNKEAEMNYRKISRDFATDNLKRSLKKYGSKEALIQARKTAYKEHHDKYSRRKGVDSEVRHIQYVRYVDDFLVGIVGSREFALQIRKDLNNFIKNNLHLEVKKDNLVSRNDKPIKFLGHFISLREYKVKTSAIPKSIRAAMKNKNKSISRFLESDKRLARAKSNQFYSNVLQQFNILSSKLKTSISNKPHEEVLASLIAYKGLGSNLLKHLSLDSWEQFNELLSSIDPHKLSSKKKNNPALSRWSSYLQIESDRLSEFSAQILYDKIASLAASDWYESLSKGQADKLKHLQEDYLIKAEEIINESLNLEVEKRRNKIISKSKINMNPKAELSQEEKDLLELAKRLTTVGSQKSSPIRISVNAPIGEVFAKLRLSGYIHPIKDRSIGNSHLGFYTDSEIVSHFNSVIRGLLNWYSGAGNFAKVKGLAHLLRSSCVLTLANKHKKSKNWVYTVYGSEVTVLNGKKETRLISRTSILNHFNDFNLKTDSSSIDHYDLDKMIDRFHKLNYGIEFFEGCSVTDCLESENIEVYHIRRLYRKVNNDGIISVLDMKGNRVTGLAAVLTSINRKQIPLCRKHHLEFESGVFSPLDYSKLNKVLLNIPKPKLGDFKPIFDGEDFTTEKKKIK